MATRSGSVDPGLVLWLAERIPVAEIGHALEHESGILGLAGTADMRAAVARGGPALDVYLHRLRAGIAAMAAAMDGLDALVFTAGVGEGSARVRAETVRGLSFLGARLDEQANEAARPDADVTAPGSPVRVLVIAAREDLEMARQVRAIVRTKG